MSDLIAEMHRLLDEFAELEPDLLEVMVAERLLRTARDAIAAAVAAGACGQPDPCQCGHEGIPICCIAHQTTPDGNYSMPCHGDRDEHPEVGCWCVCHGADCPTSGGSVCRCDIADEPDQGLYLRSGANADPSDWEL
ncbi:Uncharacterised protein [Mycobacteroides abscessus subsp. abscessus]|uniref:hypothetical protein n=1 Tax=Mycobacteroides abscessus TaxID=36809 RepID=UPI0009290E1A|nr:hypothetical protein [Mycobacteroides abscessus]SHR99383.1 Uncharacterised protein [Mycobacteroides abscessus subsp. abscessus]